MKVIPKAVYTGLTPSGIKVAVVEDVEENLVFLSFDFVVLVLPTKDFKQLAVDMVNTAVVLTGGKNKSKRKSKRV